MSNYPSHLKHINPLGFKWRRLFETWLPFTAKLTVFFPNDGQLHILNAASPVSARETRVFVPICRNFDKDAPLQDTLDFNHQVFDEDKAIVEKQFPEDLRLICRMKSTSAPTKAPSPIVRVLPDLDLAVRLLHKESLVRVIIYLLKNLRWSFHKWFTKLERTTFF